MHIKNLFMGDTNNTFIQFFRYVFVGGFAFAVDYGLMALLVELFNHDELAASTISFSAGLIVNYLLSTLWIFKDSKINNRFAEFVAFALIGIIGLAMNELIIWFFRDILAPKSVFGGLIPMDKYYLIGKLFSTCIVFMWNFFARKFIVFNNRGKK